MLYRRQLRRGKHFLHKHPQSAASWLEDPVKSVAQLEHVHVVTGDQCMYGLTTPAEGGGIAPARKSTTFMTSSRQTAELISTRCDKNHTHQPLVSGQCRNAAFYQLKLVQTILKGMRHTKDVENALDEQGIEHKSMINAIMASAGMIPAANPDEEHTSLVGRVKGGSMRITYSMQNSKNKYIDEYTGKTFNPYLIAAAIREELNYFNEKGLESRTKVEGHEE